MFIYPRRVIYVCAHIRAHTYALEGCMYRRITRLTLSVLALGLQRSCPVVCVKYQCCCESEQSCVRERESRSPCLQRLHCLLHLVVLCQLIAFE